MAKGAYVLADAQGKTPEIILIASGSEVAPALAAYEKLTGEGVAARLVSMPSWDLFEKQPQSYRDEVLPLDVTARLAGYLLQNARDGVCELPASKAQLAAHIGTVAEPLSRSLRKLKSAGLIAEDGSRIVIQDADGLRALYEGL